ncbi:MAG: lipoyl synthase [Spirochaetia bacterium]|nr:lipoyl synthase [Spirochaetia bacterium]
MQVRGTCITPRKKLYKMITTKKRITWNFHNPDTLLKWKGVHTVCEESLCPNRLECSQLKTATFLIGGKYCTRNCLFCNVQHGKSDPISAFKDIEKNEILEAVKTLDLQFAVITSVNRDDDAESLALHFHEICEELNHMNIGVELLIPDFHVKKYLLDIIAKASPKVIAHNLETVKRLSDEIRPQASYEKSLKVLQHYALHYPKIKVKSGFMVGLGETEEEILMTIKDLKNSGIHILTIGQYLQPGKHQTSVVKHYSDDFFLNIKDSAIKMGIKHVESGYFIRSSYKAGLYE